MRKFRSVTSSSDANVYVGPFGEIVVDNAGQLRIQDNVTAGGHVLTANTGNISFVDTTISPTSGNTVYLNGNLVPASNVAVDLGSADHQWRHLYVSGNTIYLGGTPLTVQNGELVVDGNPLTGGGLPTVVVPAVAPATYKGLQVAYGMIHSNSDFTEYNVNKIVIHKPAYTNITIDPDGSNDDFRVSGLGASDILALFVVYGDTNGAKSSLTLEAFAEAAIDHVILDNGVEGVYNSVDAMKTAFYANYNLLASAANGLYTAFEFFEYNTEFQVNGSTLLVGSGAVFEIVGDGLTYSVTPTSPGNGYGIGNIIRIPGTAFGQPDSRWDVDLTVTAVDLDGGVTTATAIAVLGEGWYLTGTFTGITGDITPGQGFAIYNLSYNLSNDTFAVSGWSNGTGYSIGNRVRILGTNILDANNNPLATPANDVIVTITNVNQAGQILSFTASGTLPRPVGIWPDNSISDGGADQYDTGNYINTNLANEILYNAGNTVVDGAAAFGPGSSYSFVYDTAIFGLFATGSSATFISTSGNSGGDGNSITEAGNIYDPGSPQKTFTNAVTHINLIGTPYAGPAIIFAKSDNGSEVDILIPDDGNGAGVGITRDNNQGIYNPYREGSWDSDVSPGGTLWNIDGWADLTNVESRQYAPLYETFGFGGLGNKIVGTECIMYLPDNGKYYTVKFSHWTQSGNGGGFVYSRRELNLAELEHGIVFTDGSMLNSAQGLGRVKATASRGRRIEEVTGNKTVSVSQQTTEPAVSTFAYDTRTDFYVYINWDQALVNLNESGTFYKLEFSQNNSTWYPAEFAGYSENNYIQLYMVGERTVSVNQGDTVYYRVSTGGAPVVWWDAAELPGGSSNFRGAVIDYHAYTGYGTIIGTIHIAKDSGDDNITHSETASGSTDSENDDLWYVTNEGQIRYRRLDGQSATAKIQWIAKVFYGEEYYD